MNWQRFRLKYWLEIFRSRQLNDDLDAEIEAHILIETQRRMDAGESAEAARRSALRQLRSMDAVKEATRDTWTWTPFQRMFQDLRYACRTFRHFPVFTLIVVLSVAIGIAANTTLFALADAMLLRTLSVDEPRRLVFFEWLSGPNFVMGGINGNTTSDPVTRELSSTSFSQLAFEEFRKQTQTLSDVFAFAPLDDVNVSIDGHPELVPGQVVSGNYFAGLRVPAFIGRTISDDDNERSEPIAVISHGYWQRRFASDPRILDKAITLNGVPMTIVGVTPPGFSGALGFGEPVDVSIPLELESQFRTSDQDRSLPRYWWLRVMGRLNRDVEPQQVHSELERILHTAAIESWQNERSLFPGRTDAAERDLPLLRVLSGSRGITDNSRDSVQLLILLGATSGILLLIICVNVANLLLARGAARRREIGVRLALGAGRGRLIRQLLTETILLFLIGGAVGLVLAYWGKEFVATMLSANNPASYDLRIDLPVLAFTAAVSLLTAVVFGAAPAFRATSDGIGTAMKEHSRNLLASGHRLRKTLLIVQVALSIVLLVGAGLFVRTVRNLQAVDFGFDATNLLLFQVSPQRLKYDDAKVARLYEQMQENISALPGIEGVTISSFPLVNGGGTTRRIVPQSSDSSTMPEVVRVLTVRADFFETIGIPVLAGRSLTTRDTDGASPVALINETLAQKVFSSQNPVGARFAFGTAAEAMDIEIVGVVKDARVARPRDPVPSAVFLPDLQGIPGSAAFTIRTSGDPLLSVPSIREAVRLIDPDLPIFGVRTQEQHIQQGFNTERTFALALMFFGGIALGLASIGLFGLMSYNVERRTSEIGLRIALGAKRSEVIRLVMRQSLLVVVLGVGFGIPAALVASRLISRLLYEVAPTDPFTIALASGTMLAVACFAAYLPARRAARVDPTIALRAD